MAYPTLDSYNTSQGIQVLFQYSSDIVPGYIEMVLLAFWLIAGLGSFFAQKQLTTRADISASIAVASFLTLILGISMSLISNLVNPLTLVVLVVVNVLSMMLLFFGRKE